VHHTQKKFPFEKGMKKFEEAVTKITGIKRVKHINIHVRSQEDRNPENLKDILQMRIELDGATRREFNNGELD
jgi:hypothetical protein